MFWPPQVHTFSPCRCLLNLKTDLVAAPRWPGATEGTLISLLRKWPHKSDRETHLWMLVKVLLLITSNVREAEGGAGDGVIKAWEQVSVASASDAGADTWVSAMTALYRALDSAWLWAYAGEAFPTSPHLLLLHSLQLADHHTISC